jgi:Ni,Fe-hydrogenase III large subunit
MICDGGVQFDLEPQANEQLLKAISNIKSDFTNAADLLFNEPSVLARFQNTGTISQEFCNITGIVGLAARASGCIQDVRQDFPTGIYQFSHIPIVTHPQGDVFSRAFVRYGEVLHSLTFIENQCKQLPDGAIKGTLGHLKKNSFVVSLTEGWRGEICHIALTDAHGNFSRYKIVDPSFHNWTGLAMSLRGQQISDFPLCNKSFNLSYCGYDL